METAFPEYVVQHWNEEFEVLEQEISEIAPIYLRGEDPYANDRILDRQSCILPDDQTPFDVERRRTLALIARLETQLDVSLLSESRLKLNDLSQRIEERDALEGSPSRAQAMRDYFEVAALRRNIALSNPLLDFDEVLFVGRSNYYGDDPTGQHQLSGPLAFCNRVGGGLYVVRSFKGRADVIDVLKDSVVENGSYEGWNLSGQGSFYSPELSFDGSTILFSWSENRIGRARAGWGMGQTGPIHRWPEENVWHVFSVNVDGSNLTQLTEGPWNDFDACFLPNGRIVFVSERRGGYIRCFRDTLYMEPTTYVMFSMKDDGSDVVPLSFFEASEWAPSVDNHGMLIYSRWDYIDRENGLGSKFWTCYPDGRNPRAPHGNYPHPYSVQPEYAGPKEGTRPLGPCSENHFRAIPNSSRYVFTGVPHHGASFGPLALLDTRIPDQGTMNQVTRITADQRFPESQTREGIETDDRILKYGTAWPLSEDFYLCNYKQRLILLDRFGTKTVICSHEQCPLFDVETATFPAAEMSVAVGESRPINDGADMKGPDNLEWTSRRQNIGETMRLVEPIPLRSREKPPVLPEATFGGERASIPHDQATISIMNIHVSDLPFPENRPAKWMRIVQLFPKTTPHRDIPHIGYGNEGIPRMSLGIVPVEEDGSVYCQAPVGKLLLFQALDENMMAIQSMRSGTYVHPGEQLTCVGCHEDKWAAPSTLVPPLALERAPSELLREPGSQEPATYYRTVQPIFESRCIPCHEDQGQGLQDMSYDAIQEYAFYFTGAHMNNYENLQLTGMGSRSIPGLVGAHYSKMGQALLGTHRDQRITEEQYRRVCLWLDLNSPRLGAFNDVDMQERGELVWPDLDVDPNNVTGVESSSSAGFSFE